MFYSPTNLMTIADNYCKLHNLSLVAKLGHGMQGMVFATNRQSAIKVHAAQVAYLRERDVYKRVKQSSIYEIRGCIIPTPLNFDDELFVIEMSLVSPPFILDFGGAYLDEAPEHMKDHLIRRDWLEQKQEQFGVEWPEVLAILAEFEDRLGVFIADVNPGNIQIARRQR